MRYINLRLLTYLLTPMSHWWQHEGHLAKIAPVHQLKSYLRILAHLST